MGMQKKYCFLCFLFVIGLILFIFPAKSFFYKEYPDFPTPDELIIKDQVLSMSWQKLNGPFGGQGYTIRFSPANSNKIIVTDSFAGIHISNDRGNVWVESNEGIDARSGKSGDAIPVFVTTIDPNDPNRIWCGVKNAMGVFLSTDGGITWQHKDNGLPSGTDVEIRGLAVKLGDSNTIIAAGDLEEIGPFMGAFQRTHGIVYRTTDGGENWTQVLSGGNLFKDVIFDPKNTNTVYVASGFFDRQQLEKLEGVYKSTDGGTTWIQTNNGIRNFYVTNIKFDPNDSNTIWGTTGMIPQFDTDVENQDGAIIVTRDGGMSWSEVKRQRNNGSPQLYSALGISPTNPNIIYAGAFGIFFKSADGGMTWTETGFGPLGSNAGHPIDITVNPNDENTVFVDSYVGGVFKSTDAGKTWITDAFGYSGTQANGVAVSPDSNKVFATSRSGIFLSEDKGINWIPVGLGDVGLDELQAVAPNPIDNNKVLLGDSNNAMSSIFLSVDGGMSWKTVFMLFPEEYAFHPSSTGLDGEIAFTDIKWSKSNPNIAFATCVKKSLFHDFVDSIGWGTFKSADGGMTWINKQNGIPGFKNTWSVDIDLNNENIIYAATNDVGIIKSTNGGENWNQINNGFGNVTSFHSVSICPANTNVLLAGTADGQIFRTTDAGSTWRPVLSDVRTSDNIVSIVFNPVADKHQVYAAGNVTGFYVSSDDGVTWSQYNDGLTMRELTDLDVTPDGSSIYVATNGGGIFRLPITGNPLTLIRSQIEAPSNAGIDAENNKKGNDSSAATSSSSSSSGGEVIQQQFSLNIEGDALNGITLFKNKPAKSFLIFSFDQNLFNTGLEDSKINVTSNLPKKALVIAPNKFSLTAKDSSKRVNLIIPPIKKLEKIREINKLFPNGIPESIELMITQTSQGMTFSRNINIPLLSSGN